MDIYSSERLTSREAAAAASIEAKTGSKIITIPKGAGVGDLPMVILKSRFASQNYQILMAFKAEEEGILAVSRPTRTKKDTK